MSVGPKAVVFDCDGVLVDSEKAWFVGIVNVFERKGIHELVTGPASDLYGASVGDVVAFLERELGQSPDHEEATREVYDAILEAIDEGVVAIEGAIGLLEEIGGTRPLAVASNGSLETVEASMRAAHIPLVFDAIVAVKAPLRPKPEPDLYLRACELLRVRGGGHRRRGLAPGRSRRPGGRDDGSRPRIVGGAEGDGGPGRAPPHGPGPSRPARSREPGWLLALVTLSGRRRVLGGHFGAKVLVAGPYVVEVVRFGHGLGRAAGDHLPLA